MSKQGVEALRLERQSALDLAASLSAEEWDAPSDCDGWRVRDVYAHMGGIFHGIVDPSVMDLGDDPDPERGLDHMVDVRRCQPMRCGCGRPSSGCSLASRRCAPMP